MKKYVFRKNDEGFHDWIRTVSRARNEISSYKTLVLAELKYSPDRLFRLKEAKRVYGNYMKLRSKLNDDQKNMLMMVCHTMNYQKNMVWQLLQLNIKFAYF